MVDSMCDVGQIEKCAASQQFSQESGIESGTSNLILAQQRNRGYGQGTVLYYDNCTIPSQCHKIVDFLSENNVTCQMINVDGDPEQLSYIQAKSQGQFTFPMVFVNNKVIGGYLEVYNQISKIKQICARNLIYSCTEKDFESFDQQLVKSLSPSIFNRALNLSESIFNYLNPFSYFASYKHVEHVDAVNFSVIRLNWYNRPQKRIISFTNSGVSRLNPDTMKQRDFFYYHQVREILVDGANGKITVFIQDRSKECWTTTVNAVPFIIAFFIDKCGIDLKVSKIS